MSSGGKTWPSSPTTWASATWRGSYARTRVARATRSRTSYEDDLSYARLYFDSSPVRHREAWQRLASFGDDSQTYYWRLLAARDIMRLYREDPARLERLAKLHGHGPSAEFVLHPPSVTRRFANPEELEAAVRKGVLG